MFVPRAISLKLRSVLATQLRSLQSLMPFLGRLFHRTPPCPSRSASNHVDRPRRKVFNRLTDRHDRARGLFFRFMLYLYYQCQLDGIAGVRNRASCTGNSCLWDCLSCRKRDVEDCWGEIDIVEIPSEKSVVVVCGWRNTQRLPKRNSPEGTHPAWRFQFSAEDFGG